MLPAWNKSGRRRRRRCDQLLNAQAKGLTKRFTQGVTSLERGAGPSSHGIHRRSNPQSAQAFPANLSGKADSEGKRHSQCCGFSLPLEFL